MVVYEYELYLQLTSCNAGYVPPPPSTRTQGAMRILWDPLCVGSSLATRCSQTDSGAHPATCPVGTTVFVQRLEPDHSCPSSVEVENFGSKPPLPHLPSSMLCMQLLFFCFLFCLFCAS
jgi:hypothetical protein